MVRSAPDWATAREPWTASALKDLLPDLSVEEQVRLQSHLREHERIRKRYNKNSPPRPPHRSEIKRDTFIIPQVRFAIHHYNATNPGGEFDPVKPLMEDSVGFRGQAWYHLNFWARCRKSNKIKRFFAEVHYNYKPATRKSICSDRPFPAPEADVHNQPPASSSVLSDWVFAPIPIVEACVIIEEPLGQYRRSCAFCCGRFDILHPKGRKFVCGNDKDRMVQQLALGGSGQGPIEMPFTCAA